LFLSAPYGEALFSFLNFSGMLLYVESRIFHPSMPWDILRGCQLIGSGALFAMAALIRSNGVLSGLIFVYDVVTLLPRLLSLSLGPSDFRRLLFTTIAGSLILLGFAGPQWLAYDEYCGAQVSSVDRRPWCSMYVPSIYSWVQSYYW
jgi:phosphatidylinositol glycan class V